MPAMRMTKTIEAGGRKVAAGTEPLICTASPVVPVAITPVATD